MRDATLSLLLDWSALMALSLVLGFAGAPQPGVVALAVIGCAAAFKARIILRSYLGLVRAPAAAAGFFSVVVAVLALVVASVLIFPTPSGKICRAHPVFARTFAGGIE